MICLFYIDDGFLPDVLGGLSVHRLHDVRFSDAREALLHP